LQLEGEEMDIEIEMGIYSDDEPSSGIEGEGGGEASSPPSPRQFFREATPFPNDVMSDNAEETLALSPEAQQRPDEGSDTCTEALPETRPADKLPTAPKATESAHVKGLAAAMKSFSRDITPD
jgi:hypothetical protein